MFLCKWGSISTTWNNAKGQFSQFWLTLLICFSRDRGANSILDSSVSTAVVPSPDHCDVKRFKINHFLKYRPILFWTLTTNFNHAFTSDLYQFKKNSFKMYTFVYIAASLRRSINKVSLRSSCRISSEMYSLTWINDSLSDPALNYIDSIFTCMIQGFSCVIKTHCHFFDKVFNNHALWSFM